MASRETEKMLAAAAEKTREEIHILCSIEKIRPHTMQENHWLHVSAQMWGQLFEKVTSPPLDPISLLDGKTTNRTLPNGNISEDPMAEISVISKVYADLHLCKKRLTDAIPQRIEYHFIRGFSVLLADLKHELGLLDPNRGADRCAMYTRFEADHRMKRKGLEERQKVFEQADRIVNQKRAELRGMEYGI